MKQASFEKTLREYAEADYDVIIGDAFAAEEITRRVAREYQHIAFCFGSGLGPAKPNFSVFDNWIHEPAFVAGMIAGRLTRSNMVGIVGGYPIPEVNRITNAFIEGAREVNAEVVFRVAFINSWFDPAKAKEATLAMISQGVDVMYAERDGVIEACDEKQVPVFGNLIDQGNQSEWVVTSVVWDMTPTIRRLVNNVQGGIYTAEDFGEWSGMSKEGSRLSPFTPDWEAQLGLEILNMVQSRTDDIILGKFRVPIIESDPYSMNRRWRQAQRDKWPGITSSLREKLREIRTRQKNWPVVAAMQAEEFVRQPSWTRGSWRLCRQVEDSSPRDGLLSSQRLNDDWLSPEL